MLRRFCAGLWIVSIVALVSTAAAGKNDSATSTEGLSSLVLSVNKAKIIDLPGVARDVLVTNPAIADVIVKTPRRVYILGKAVGDTNVFFFDANGKQIERLELRVELDLSALREALREFFPDVDIKARAVNRTIVLSGRARSSRVAENARLLARRFTKQDAEIVNMIEVVSDQQVLLQVRISEMQRSVVKQLGVNTTIGESSTNFRVIPQRSTQTDTFSTLFLNIESLFGGPFTTFSSLIDALEREGLVKTLAQPNLTAVSGENAKFLAGGEFPVPVASEDNKISIEFKEFGVLLSFTPVVLSSGAISLRMQTEVSKVTFDNQIVLAGTSIPSLTIRRAETTVEIPSGGSLIIAGLLQNDNENTIDGLPFLKDLPIVGALFRSFAFTRGETELVITVSPYVVRPTDARKIVLPTDGFVPASDLDLYILGRLHAVYSKPGKSPPRGGIKGPIGFIME